MSLINFNLIIVAGAFNRLGVAEGSLNFTLGYISEMRLVVQNVSSYWVILSEVSIRVHVELS